MEQWECIGLWSGEEGGDGVPMEQWECMGLWSGEEGGEGVPMEQWECMGLWSGEEGGEGVPMEQWECMGLWSGEEGGEGVPMEQWECMGLWSGEEGGEGVPMECAVVRRGCSGATYIGQGHFDGPQVHISQPIILSCPYLYNIYPVQTCFWLGVFQPLSARGQQEGADP